jgi:AraC-like DNA-binding protein
MGDSFTASSLERETPEGKSFPNYWAEKGKKLIDENYHRLYGVEDTSAILGITPGYFRDSFYAAYSISPKLYLTSVKIDKACLILREGRMKVSDVAAAVGLRDRSVFEKTFKKLVGVSPSEYRRLSAAVEKDTRK